MNSLKPWLIVDNKLQIEGIVQMFKLCGSLKGL